MLKILFLSQCIKKIKIKKKISTKLRNFSGYRDTFGIYVNIKKTKATDFQRVPLNRYFKTMNEVKRAYLNINSS